MSDISNQEAAYQKGYRQGYAHGVGAMISALKAKLSLDEREKLEVWFGDVLTPWLRFQSETFAPPEPPSLRANPP
jgi:hypothetical protein